MNPNLLDYGYILRREQSSILFEESPIKSRVSLANSNQNLKYERVIEGIPRKIKDKESINKIWKVIADEVLHPTPHNEIFQSIFNGYTRNEPKVAINTDDVNRPLKADPKKNFFIPSAIDNNHFRKNKHNLSFSLDKSQSFFYSNNANIKEAKKVGMFKVIRRKSCCCDKCGSLTALEKTLEFIPSEIKNIINKRQKSIQELSKPSYIRNMKARFTHQISPITLLLGREDKKSIELANNFLKPATQPTKPICFTPNTTKISIDTSPEPVKKEKKSQLPLSATLKRKQLAEFKIEKPKAEERQTPEDSKIVFAFDSPKGDLVLKMSSEMNSFANNPIHDQNLKSFSSNFYSQMFDLKKNEKLLQPVTLSKKHGYSYSLGSITVNSTPRDIKKKGVNININLEDIRRLVQDKLVKLDTARNFDKTFSTFFNAEGRRNSEAYYDKPGKQMHSAYHQPRKVSLPKLSPTIPKPKHKKIKIRRDQMKSIGGSAQENRFLSPRAKKMLEPYLNNV